MSDDLRAHLEYFGELGVNGIRMDSTWHARGTPAKASSLNDPRPHFLPLAAIREDLGPCTRCKLHALGRKQIVFGVGNPHADLMFVGEAPGADEDIQGEPFVGRAGQLLTKLIEAINLRREDVVPLQSKDRVAAVVLDGAERLLRRVTTVAPGAS